MRDEGLVMRLAAAMAALGLGTMALGEAAAQTPAPVAGPPPLEAYGRLPAIEDAAISPDGQRLALVLTDGDHRNVVVQTLADHKVVGGIKAGDTKLFGLQWGDATHLFVTTETTLSTAEFQARSYMSLRQAVELDTVTNQQTQVLGNIVGSAHILLSNLEFRQVGGKSYAFAIGYHDTRGVLQPTFYRIEVATGRTEAIAEGRQTSTDWLVDAKGELLARVDYDDDKGWWSLGLRRGSDWKTVKTTTDKLDHPDLLGLGRDGASVVIETGGGEADSVREWAPTADTWGDPIADGAPSPVYDEATGVMVGYRVLDGDRLRYSFFDPRDRAIWQAVQRAYPGAKVELVSWSADHHRIVVSVDGVFDGLALALVDVDSGQAGWIGDAYKQAAAHIATRKSISFKAQDGTPLTGYLTVPNVPDLKNLPLVVFPHGGPATRDEPGFDWWAQAMASRGYAVLQVNYRGSAGFGWKFMAAGFGQWGRAMQTDLSDGVHFLAGQGTIDPKRVCIVGASYGGYAALAGAALQPDVYRCAVSVSGVSDPSRFVAWARDRHGLGAQRYWLNFMGVDGIHDVALTDISPAAHAGAVTGPVLLIHGHDDYTVPFEQSQIMADALRKAGKPVELVSLAHEDHYLLHGATRLQMLQAVIDFLQKNNPPN